MEYFFFLLRFRHAEEPPKVHPLDDIIWRRYSELIPSPVANKTQQQRRLSDLGSEGEEADKIVKTTGFKASDLTCLDRFVKVDSQLLQIKLKLWGIKLNIWRYQINRKSNIESESENELIAKLISAVSKSLPSCGDIIWFLNEKQPILFRY